MNFAQFGQTKPFALLASAIGVVFPLGLMDPLPTNGADGGGLLGSPLGDTEKHSDLFAFFHLEETGATTNAAGLRVVTFKPSARNFRSLATLNVTVDKDGAIVQLELLLARSFIDDKTNGVFARDLAKSVLRDALAAPSQTGIADLTNEIEFHRGTDGMVLLARPAPRLPDPPSAGYRTFLGKEPQFEQALAGAQLRLENRQAAGGNVLAITVAAH